MGQDRADAARRMALRRPHLHHQGWQPGRASRCGPRAAGRPARVHLAVDTGLSREGATPDLWPDLVAAAARSGAHLPQHVKQVWHLLARFGRSGATGTVSIGSGP